MNARIMISEVMQEIEWKSEKIIFFR